MVKNWFAALCPVIVLFSVSQASYADDKWVARVDFFNQAAVGNDVHVGDIFSYEQNYKFDGLVGTQQYGAIYTPLVVKMNSHRAVLGEGGYVGEKWSVLVRGWSFRSEGSLSGNVGTPAPAEDSQSVVTVRLFGQTILPLGNDLKPNRMSDVDYWASNGLSVSKVDVVLKRKQSFFNVGVGASFGKIKNQRNEGEHQEAFFYYWYFPMHFRNEVRLETFSGAETSLLLGPSLTLDGTVPWRKMKFEWSYTESLLVGKVNKSANLVDTDDISAVGGPVGGPFDEHIKLLYFHGEFPTREMVGAAIAVYELRFGADYSLGQQLSLGGGFFVSSWSGVPLAPSLAVPGQWTSGAGTGWKLADAANLVFSGYSISLRVKF